MNELLRIATCELASFLASHLPGLGADWWSNNVVIRLNFQQQRVSKERGHFSLNQLDFTSLLRVLDQNWHELSNVLTLPREGRTWVKELQTVPNKWANLSTEEMPPSEMFRDADTMGRLLKMIGAAEAAVLATEVIKADAVMAMASANPEKSKLVSAATSPPTSELHSLFRVGDLVSLRSNPKLVLPVIEIVLGGPECRYRVFQNNAKAIYFESQLLAPAPVPDSFTTLAAHDLQARVTSIHILSPSTANLFSLRSGRVQFVPYQYRPVLKLIRSDRPRLLIADEVGVGKTIEAGLIIKELRARINLSSVLIICPKALVAERKWFLEMKRFDEHFTALDSRLLLHCLQETDLEGEWPSQYAKAILPFSLFDSQMIYGGEGSRARKEHSLLGLDPSPKFDLVIVDEAHHIRNPETFLHQGIRFFCDNAEAVVFLSATPVQLGSEDLFTLLNVLRPDLIIDHASFQQMAEPNRHINMAVHHCRAAQSGWQNDARAALDQVAQTEWGRLFLRESPSFQNVYDQLQTETLDDASRIGLTRVIEEMYTFGQLINRTRRRDIGEFTTRKPGTQSIEFTAAQKSLHDDTLELIATILAFCHGDQNIKFMMTTIRRQAASCIYGLAPLLKNILSGKLNRLELLESDGDEELNLSFVERVRKEIAVIISKAENLDLHDPKAEAFCNTLTAKSKLVNNKAIVFSTFRHTLAYLAQRTERTGLRFGIIHGDIPDDERADLRRRFALSKDSPGAIDVLLSSEVGCEGLDFQFCDFLINYDLPWNPMRIEQRIGRIDRYGQKSETVAIINFITPGTVDADIYMRCLLRIGVFHQSIGGSEEILGEITQELHDIAESFTLSPKEREARLQQLADNKLRHIKEEQDLESKQGELFGLNLPRQSWREEIAAAESFWLSPPALQKCVACYLAARSGSESEHLLGEKALKTLRLGQEIRRKLLEDFQQLSGSHDSTVREWEKWLKGNQPTLAVTFDAGAATEDMKLVYLTVLHPLVRQAAQFLQLHEPVRATLRVHNADLPAESYPFALYRWKMRGVKQDESLVPITTNEEVEAALLTLLQSAVDAREGQLPTEAQLETLDIRHHAKWSAVQANHLATTRELVDHRTQSLTVSHRARCKAITDQITGTSNKKIQLMKQSELGRANTDFNRRIEDLQRAANSGDVHATAIVFGIITVTRENLK